jgi:glycosyl transferase family 25
MLIFSNSLAGAHHMQSFIIHMSASTSRRANVDLLLEVLPNAQVVEAVNGHDPIQIADVKTHPGTLHTPRYPFALTPPEIGIFQSHRACWQRIVDDSLEMALIVEDDFSTDPEGFETVLKFVQDHATEDSFVRFPIKTRERAAQVIASQGEHQLILPRAVGLQCTCQLVGRKAAERLLLASNEIDRPVDSLIQLPWATGQVIHCVLPSGAREVSGQIGGSTIQRKIPLRQKAGREFKRLVYRMGLKLRSQRAT